MMTKMSSSTAAQNPDPDPAAPPAGRPDGRG